MAFFNDLGKKITDTVDVVGKKTNEVVEIQKLRGQISSLERETAGCYEELGRILFEKYENQYPDNEVSLISYTQSTGGVPLCIKKSTNDALCGAVMPIWLINPYGIGEDNFFENKSFLDRQVILVSSKKANPVTFYYDMQYIKVMVPKKVVIINKKDYAENGEQKVYRLYNLSLWGAISLMFKVAVIILLIALLRRVLKRILKRQNAKQEPCRKEQSEDEKGV